MELKILNKKEEPLLSRTRVEVEIVFEKATPSGQEVKSNLAKTLGVDEKLIDIKGIYTFYGLKKAKVLCYAYENEEILKRIKVEKKKKTEKKEEKKEEVKEEAKEEDKAKGKEEKQEAKDQKDKKPEEKKEEQKTEGKPEKRESQ